ncbi:MAG: hypothetical protein MUE85_00485 [Microscillaceae bacterium]|jgi:hypothetical protein|nr:hypothetical protein [Microscillaceae bacterium]
MAVISTLKNLWTKYLTLQSESEKQTFWLEYENYLRENPEEIKNGFDTMLARLKEMTEQMAKTEKLKV